MSFDSIAIVGASLSGVRTAEALRRNGYDGGLSIIGDESQLPYDRPPLSKGYLAGKREAHQLLLRPAFPDLADLDVTLISGDPVVSVDFSTHELRTVSQRQVRFDLLVAATGTRLRRLAPEVFAGDHHPPVYGLRTLDDARNIRAFLVQGSRVVIVGGGFIGAEVASTASSNGAIVTVVEAAHLPLERQLGTEMASVCAGLHDRQSVRLLCDTTVVSIDSLGVHLSNGECLRADVIVVGVGVVPNTEWLGGTECDISNGVLCDDRLRATPTMFAVGDVARWTNPRYAETARIEHWTNAVESGEHVANAILGVDVPYAPIPYFWSDQYGAKIQCFGRTTGFDEVRVIAGSTDDMKFVAIYRKNNKLVAALGVSMVRQLMNVHQLLVDELSWKDAISALL